MLKTLIVMLCLVVSPVSYSADKGEFTAFFDEYQRLFSEFDASVSQLYAHDAKIMGARKKPDGTEESMTINGAQWKTIILASMEKAKQIGDLSEYSDVSIEVSGDQAKISATKYSVVNCFHDKRFYMVVKATGNTGEDNQLQIVEQFMETSAKSSCNSDEPDLPEFLQSTVEMINEQLPAKIDDETQLVRTSANGTKLIYHYVLINHTSETLTTEEATAKLQPVVVQQSCTSPNLRPILDQNGSLSYIYTGSDATQIVKLDVNLSACSG